MPAIIVLMRFAPIYWKWPAIYEAAIKHDRIAAGQTTSIPERDYLVTQAGRLSKAGNIVS